MTALPPLRFKPILRDYLWGGRRLSTELGKSTDGMERCAESWEIVDHGADQSVVATGALRGRTLHEIVLHDGAALFGRHHLQQQFPLLLKFLDCQKTLSVQVHPNDAQAAMLEPPDLGKTEAWVVLAAEPGSRIYAGLKTGVNRRELEQSLERGTCDECLHAFEPRAGECLLIEAGTVHALGAGLLVAEIQQASDVTFRLFDWNRVDRDGKPRALHIEQALDVINFGRGPVAPANPSATEEDGVERLVSCEKFMLDRRRLSGKQTLSRDDRFHILAVVDGNVTMTHNEGEERLRRGDSVLVPASARDVDLLPQGMPVMLDMYLP